MIPGSGNMLVDQYDNDEEFHRKRVEEEDEELVECDDCKAKMEYHQH